MSLCEHGPGHCEAAYDGNAKFMCTVGADSAMVLREAETGAESNLVADEHDYRPIRSLAISPIAAEYTAQLVTGCDAGTLRVFTFPELQFKSIVHRFDAPVRQLAYSTDGKLVGVVVEDSPSIQLFDATTEELKCKLTKHSHHVRSIAFDPSGKYLASTGGDGAMAVWDVSKGVSSGLQPTWSSAKLLKDAKGTPEQHLHRLAWRPDGTNLAVPLGADITVLAPPKWNDVMSLRGGKATDGHQADVSVLAYSPSGRYLASGDITGRVVVWDTESARPVDSRTLNAGQPLCSLSWDPKRNALLSSDRDGRVMTPWTNVIPTDLPPPFAACMPRVPVAQEDDEVGASPSPKKPAGAFEEDEADEEEEENLEGQLDELSDEDETVDTERLQGGADRFATVMLGIEERAKAAAQEERMRGIQREDREDRHMVPETRAQEPFCSGNTPFEDGRRQLGWSLVGRATSVERRDHSSIEIEFEDTSRFRRPLQFIDPGRCTMGDIGETGAVFAAPQRGHTLSHIHFRFFDSWDGEGWTCEMDDGEEVVAVAVGRKFVAAATSLRNLRVFSSSGMQLFTGCLPGAPVTLAASENDQLAVVFHSGRGLPTEQGLAVELWDLPNKTAMDIRPLPLSSGETSLRWLGFATNGVLASCDSSGVVRAMIAEWNYRWTPIANLDKEAAENERLSVVGLTLMPDMHHLQCVPFKSTRKYPVVLPKPLPKLIKVKLDLKDSGGYGGPVEYLLRQQQLIKSEQLAEDHGDFSGAAQIRRSHDTSLLKLLMKLIKADEGMKVLALCELSNNPLMMLGHAAKAANAYGKRQLTERLQRRMTAIREEERAAAEAAGEFMEEDAEEQARSAHARTRANTLSFYTPPPPPPSLSSAVLPHLIVSDTGC